MITVEELMSLTRELDAEDPIDWGMLNIDDDEALRLIAMDVLGMFKNIDGKCENQIIMLVTITKLILENFVLHIKLHQKD